jgi:hypothetical protein
VAQTFWSALTDTWLLASLLTLGPTHWGLRNMVYGLLARAYAKGSSELLARATSFMQNIGVHLGQVSGPLSHVTKHTVSTTFDAIHQKPLQAHDRTLGYVPKPWAPDHIKQRLICVTAGLNTGHGRIALSKSLYEIVDKELMVRLSGSPNPIVTLAEELLEEESLHRGLQACIYMIGQYSTKRSGPLSVKISAFRLRTGQIFDMYITYWVEHLVNFVQIYELVRIGSVVTKQEPQEQAVSMDDVPEESLSAARALTNMMKS